VIVDWGQHYGKIPCEIWCFVDLRMLPTNVRVKISGVNVRTGVYAVVESSEYEDEDNGIASDIFRPIIKEAEVNDNGNVTSRQFYLADVETFVDPVVVVPDIGADERWHYFTV